MTIAAAKALARYTEEAGIDAERIVPRMDESEVFARVAAATAVRAQEEGVTQLSMDHETLLSHSREVIHQSQRTLEVLFDSGLILTSPGRNLTTTRFKTL